MAHRTVADDVDERGLTTPQGTFEGSAKLLRPFNVLAAGSGGMQRRLLAWAIYLLFRGSILMAKATYFTDVMMINVQMISDSTPSTASLVGVPGLMLKMVFSV